MVNDSVGLKYESLETFWTRVSSQDLGPMLDLMTAPYTMLKPSDAKSQSVSAFEVRKILVNNKYDLLIYPSVVITSSMLASACLPALIRTSYTQVSINPGRCLTLALLSFETSVIQHALYSVIYLTNFGDLSELQEGSRTSAIR